MTFLVYGAFTVILAAAVRWHVRGHRQRESAIQDATRKRGLTTAGPRAQHPHIDVDFCIGCGGCVSACPEGDVLAVIGGKAALINGHKCIGHGLCADACPVGAIEIVMASPAMTADLPALSPVLETSIENLFVAGELGGLALIRNAIIQGKECVDQIAGRVAALRNRPGLGEAPVDVVVVGAGPAGLSASLRALELGLSCVTLEAEDFGGTVAKYPRQKLVMTSPVEFPVIGKFKKLEIGKEELLALWEKAAKRVGLSIRAQERVEEVRRDAGGRFTVVTAKGKYHALTVVMAIGRRGTPRKLGVPGEELPHVMYSLLDAEAYTDKRILVVGGGDSAVEAAMGLALQSGNRVTLSYRKPTFSRLKDRNETRIREAIAQKTIDVVFDSEPREIRPGSAVLDVGGLPREIGAEFVWIFAGGSPPKEFLEKMGIAFGRQELSDAVKSEAQGRGTRPAAA